MVASAPAKTLSTNSQPCNGLIEFCNRSYSNITYIAAHNFPFTRAHNIARNQELGMINQLNDGIRMLQAQAHIVNGTAQFCHISCEILNAGPVEAQCSQLVDWLEQPRNRFEVVTILLVNYNGASVDAFVPSIQNSGLEKYLYSSCSAGE